MKSLSISLTFWAISLTSQKKAGNLANSSCVQAAVTAAGTATTDLHILEGSMPKAGILRATWNEQKRELVGFVLGCMFWE